jgi:hypothetical protein
MPLVEQWTRPNFSRFGRVFCRHARPRADGSILLQVCFFPSYLTPLVWKGPSNKAHDARLTSNDELEFRVVSGRYVHRDVLSLFRSFHLTRPYLEYYARSLS